MQVGIRITDVRFKEAGIEDVERGLLGWVSCTVNGVLRLDGITVRRTREGHLALSFPARRDTAGRQHAYVRPLGQHVRREIEDKVLHALELEGPFDDESRPARIQSKRESRGAGQ